MAEYCNGVRRYEARIIDRDYIRFYVDGKKINPMANWDAKYGIWNRGRAVPTEVANKLEEMLKAE